MKGTGSNKQSFLFVCCFGVSRVSEQPKERKIVWHRLSALNENEIQSKQKATERFLSKNFEE